VLNAAKAAWSREIGIEIQGFFDMGSDRGSKSRRKLSDRAYNAARGRCACDLTSIQVTFSNDDRSDDIVQLVTLTLRCYKLHYVVSFSNWKLIDDC